MKTKKGQLNDRKRFNRQSKRLRINTIKPKVSSDLLIICCIQSTNEASKATKRILKELNLTSMYSAIFARNTEELQKKLILIEPFVAWGKPEKTLVDELLTKHAHAMVSLCCSTLRVLFVEFMHRSITSVFPCLITLW